MPSLEDSFFLRFLCPAIVSPEGFGILIDTPLEPDARRALILVSKLLQNLSNGKDIGVKEQWMRPLQVFITKHLDEMKAFFDKLADIDPEKVDNSPLITVTDAETREYVLFLHCQVVQFLPKMEENLLVRAKQKGFDPPSEFPPLLQLRKILAQLGPSPDEKIQKIKLDNIKKERIKNGKKHLHSSLQSKMQVQVLHLLPLLLPPPLLNLHTKKVFDVYSVLYCRLSSS